jgi:SAM-dependent methyltransferase
VTVKRPEDVGRDFDRYAASWSKERYRMETGYSARGVEVDESKSALVQRPGDEWGEVEPLFQAYGAVIDRYLPDAKINLLEIGAGGGRSTAVMLELLGARVESYHVVDVSAGFVQVLRDRIDYPLEIHIVDDVDLSFLPANHFSLCFSQSAWSHINLYDQYRYMRELRRVLKPDSPLYVHGQFLLGLGHDWTWNRFSRRVRQIENNADGVFHEFTSYAALAEMLVRLRYEIDCIFTNGFIARTGGHPADSVLAELNENLSFPFQQSLTRFLTEGASVRHVMPGNRRPVHVRSDSSAEPSAHQSPPVETAGARPFGSVVRVAGMIADDARLRARRWRRAVRSSLRR